MFSGSSQEDGSLEGWFWEMDSPLPASGSEVERQNTEQNRPLTLQVQGGSS